MFKYSTFAPRFFAGLIDGLVFLPVTLLDRYFTSPSRSAFVLIAWALFSYPSYWIYSVALHAYRGQTVGKKSEHVKVLDVSEQRIPSLKQAFLRDIGAIILNCLALTYFVYLVVTKQYDGFVLAERHRTLYILGWANIAWFLLEITTMFTNSKRRALHDFIAGTVVVRVQ